MTDDLGSYYVLQTANRMFFYLDIAEGYRLVTVLEVLRDNLWVEIHANADPMFVKFTDSSGSEGILRAVQIESLYTSTPETRARDDDLQRLRKADKKWDDDE